MTRINLYRRMKDRSNSSAASSVAWGKSNFEKTASTAIFAAALIACSIAVGCSSESAKQSGSSNPSLSAQNQVPQMPVNVAPPTPVQPEAKPVPKKTARKRPATVAYVNQNYGVSFEYPRRYAIETGDAAQEAASSNVLPMNFVVPGGTALAAVELPETGFANTDFSSAFFNVSVNRNMSAEECGKFAVPEGAATSSPALVPAEAVAQTAQETPAVDQPKTEAEKPVQSAASIEASPANDKTVNGNSNAPAPEAAASLMLKDLEMQKTEAVAGDGSRQSDAKYFHVYQNGACYEFSLNVNTLAAQTDGGMKHIDRDKVFQKLEKIMATVKISPIEQEKEKTAATEPAAAPSAEAGTPAQ